METSLLLKDFPVMETFQYFLFLLCVVLATSVLAVFIRSKLLKNSSFFRRTNILTVVLIVAGIVLSLKLSPEDIRPHLLSLIGIVISAGIALSAATFISNAMAGMMIQVIRNFRIGDFISCEKYFGRVTRQGILHTEIQTEERLLITIPNLFLVTHPVTVIYRSGAVISANISLGYNISNRIVEQLLGEAAERAGLKDPFVQILDLGNHSVSYRCAGFLIDSKTFFTAQSLLRAKMLDVFHENDIEIVSPDFMNQRRLDPEKPVIPDMSEPHRRRRNVELGVPEALVFDKAEKAVESEELGKRLKRKKAEIEELENMKTTNGQTHNWDQVDKLISTKRMELLALKKKIESRKELPED